jgi:hypothetical protein
LAAYCNGIRRNSFVTLIKIVDNLRGAEAVCNGDLLQAFRNHSKASIVATIRVLPIVVALCGASFADRAVFDGAHYRQITSAGGKVAAHLSAEIRKLLRPLRK